MTRPNLAVARDPFQPPSIQGEQQRERQAHHAPMDQDAVEDYVAGASDDVLVCRQRGRHFFPPLRRGTPLVFTDTTPEGLLVREVPCESCGPKVYRLEHWEAVKIRGRRDFRYTRVFARLDYRPAPDGSRYLGPKGEGRMSPRQVAEALATSIMKGVSITEVRKAARSK